MTRGDIRRQISLSLTSEEHQAIQLEAACQRVPMTVLVKRWIDPHISRCRTKRTDNRRKITDQLRLRDQIASASSSS